eukprot:scaffold289_cov169-Ochromonas_danica.AAC.2
MERVMESSLSCGTSSLEEVLFVLLFFSLLPCLPLLADSEVKCSACSAEQPAVAAHPQTISMEIQHGFQTKNAETIPGFTIH